MKLPPIVTIPDPILRRTLPPVTNITEEIEHLATTMIEVMRQANGVGLAANQIGNSTRMFVYGFEAFDFDGKRQDGVKPQAIINPVIDVLDSEVALMDEGCLSIPGLTGPVVRPTFIRLRGIDVNGNDIHRELHHYEARVVQHETDHLNGRLYLDYITDPTKLRRDEE